MDLENAMPEAPIDPQLELLTSSQGNLTPDAMAYSYPTTSFDQWNSMFQSIGDFPQATQDPGMMNSDHYSDTSSSFSFGNDQNAEFLMSPIQGASLTLDHSPGNTSITSVSEPGASTKTDTHANTNISAGNANTNTNTNTKKDASKATKGKKGHRRARSESEKKEQVKQRNRVAASKCRQKKKVKVDELKEMQSNLEAQNNQLRMEFQKLREEIGQVKSNLINHTECNDVNINRWVENEAKGFVKKLVENGERQRMASISSSEGNPMGVMPMQSFEGVSNMPLADPYMGLDQ
ncbi:hypothetical protein FP744_10004770 [Trichoderma asperellum]